MARAGVSPRHRRNSQARARRPAVFSACSGIEITKHQGHLTVPWLHVHEGCGAEPRACEDRHSSLLWLREDGLTSVST